MHNMFDLKIRSHYSTDQHVAKSIIICSSVRQYWLASYLEPTILLFGPIFDTTNAIYPAYLAIEAVKAMGNILLKKKTEK